LLLDVAGIRASTDQQYSVFRQMIVWSLDASSVDDRLRTVTSCRGLV